MKGSPGIYALVDPRSGQVRYIGLSGICVYARNKALRTQCVTDQQPKRDRWLRELFTTGGKPGVRLLELMAEGMTITQLGEREQWWIAQGKEQGWRLTNLTTGGQVTQWSEESRRKLSHSQKKRFAKMFADPVTQAAWWRRCEQRAAARLAREEAERKAAEAGRQRQLTAWALANYNSRGRRTGSQAMPG